MRGQRDMTTATPEVISIGKMNLSGNIVPQSWYARLLSNSGKPYLVAIILLSEIVYWYRPTIIRDEDTGSIVEYRRKFKADKLQRSYDSFAEQFGVSKRQVARAMHWLASKGLIDLDFRVIHTETGLTLSNVLFIGINPEKVQEITYGTVPCDKKRGGVLPKKVIGITKNGETYTETTTETTTDDTSVSLPDDGKDAKTKTHSVLEPSTPEELVMFKKLSENAEAKGWRRPRRFPSLECKQKFDEAVSVLGPEFEMALTKALEQGIVSVVGVTNYIAKWKKKSGVLEVRV